MKFIFAQSRPPKVLLGSMDPDSIPNLQIRFQAQSLVGTVADGGQVSQWMATGILGAFAATWAASPQLIHNANNQKAAVRFNGFTQLRILDSNFIDLYWNSDYTVFCVCRPAVQQSGFTMLVSLWPNGPGLFGVVDSAGNPWGTYHPSYYSIPAGSSLTPGEMVALSMIGYAGGSGEMFRDSQGPVSYPASDPTSSSWIGGREVTSQNFRGDIFEIIVYSRRLTEEERLGVMGYLRNTYGF